jgi:hypothetical protein
MRPTGKEKGHTAEDRRPVEKTESRLVHRLDANHRRALVATFIWTGTVAERAESLGVRTEGSIPDRSGARDCAPRRGQASGPTYNGHLR